jgi:hypothetical protein
LTADRTKIDVEKLQARTVDQLRAVFAHPDFLRDFGLVQSGQPAAAPGAAFPPELAGSLFNLINLAIRSRYAARYGERAALLGIGDEHAKLGAPKAARLIDKYVPNVLGKWEEEADFILWSLAVLAANIEIARSLERGTVTTLRPAAVVDKDRMGVADESDRAG